MGSACGFTSFSWLSHSMAISEATRGLWGGSNRALPEGVFKGRLSKVTAYDSPLFSMPTSFQNRFNVVSGPGRKSVLGSVTREFGLPFVSGFTASFVAVSLLIAPVDCKSLVTVVAGERDIQCRSIWYGRRVTGISHTSRLWRQPWSCSQPYLPSSKLRTRGLFRL